MTEVSSHFIPASPWFAACVRALLLRDYYEVPIWCLESTWLKVPFRIYGLWEMNWELQTLSKGLNGDSFYVFTFVRKKLISRTKPDKERTVAKPLQLKRKKKKSIQIHTQSIAEKKISRVWGFYVCVYIFTVNFYSSKCLWLWWQTAFGLWDFKIDWKDENFEILGNANKWFLLT